MAQRFDVTLWGARGSIACAGADTMRYGGHTACLEVRCGERLLILDAGTRMRLLGVQLDKGPRLDAELLFTHTQSAHICGLPFFSTVYNAKNRFRLWAGHLLPDHTLRYVLSEMMMAPLFPIPITVFGAEMEFHDFHGGEALPLGDGIVCKTAALNHPNGATGYRIEYAGKSICYVTDTEHVPGKPDQNILALIKGADYVIYDCTYTDAQFSAHVGWGHSTWQEGARLCDAAGARTLVIFHHDPGHDDEFMDGIKAAAEKARPGTIVAHEGLTLTP